MVVRSACPGAGLSPSALGAWLGRHREQKVGFLKGEGFTRPVGPKNRAMVLTVLTRA